MSSSLDNVNVRSTPNAPTDVVAPPAKSRNMMIASSIGALILVASTLGLVRRAKPASVSGQPTAIAPSTANEAAGTYPIPPEAAADPRPVEAAPSAAAPSSADDDQPAAAATTTGSKATAHARQAHKIVRPARVEARPARASSPIAAAPAPVLSRRSSEPAARDSAAASDVKKRVPLVDDASRVRILE